MGNSYTATELRIEQNVLKFRKNLRLILFVRGMFLDFVLAYTYNKSVYFKYFQREVRDHDEN